MESIFTFLHVSLIRFVTYVLGITPDTSSRIRQPGEDWSTLGLQTDVTETYIRMPEPNSMHHIFNIIPCLGAPLCGQNRSSTPIVCQENLAKGKRRDV